MCHLHPLYCYNRQFFKKQYWPLAFNNTATSDAFDDLLLCRLVILKVIPYFLAPVSQNLTRLYLDKATLVWNGNAVSGHDALGEFFESLPSSEFQVHTLDCQPVHGQ